MQHLFAFTALCCGLICLTKGQTQGQHFQNNTYYFHDNAESMVNFTKAEAECNSSGAMLVIIKDETTQRFIEQVFVNSLNGTAHYWAGARRDLSWQWLWVDGSKLACTNDTRNCSIDEYTNWSIDRPTGNAMVALALISNKSSGYLGEWIDVRQADKNFFICQKALCADVSCENGKTCVPMNITYQCQCPDGSNCNASACDSNPCKNGGSCTPQDDSYICVCSGIYTGPECETEIDPCDSAPCLHNGTCQSENLNYYCTCTAEYTGTNCTEEVNAGGSTNWAIIGGAVGGAVALIILVVVTVLLVRYYRNREPERQEPKRMEIVVPHRNNYTPNPRDFSNRGSFDTDSPSPTPNMNDEYATEVTTRSENNAVEADNLLDKCLSMQENDNAFFRYQFQKLLAVLASAKGERHYVNTAFHQGEQCAFSRIMVQSAQGTSAGEALKSGVYQFLSMQSPKRTQASKYWQTIWAESCPIVVSFYGENSSTEYIPEGNSVRNYGTMRVHNTSSQHKAHYVIITYEIEQNDTSGGAYEVSSKHVTEFQWKELGDMTSVLTHPGFHHFMTDLRNMTNKTKPPCSLLVHSKEGTAEQSCFVAYFAFLQHLKKSKHLEIFETVMEFRLQCDVFMESLDDYILLHKLLAESHVLAVSDTNDKQIGFKTKVLQRAVDGRTGFDNELDKIEKLQSLNIVSKFERENKEESQYLPVQQSGDQANICYLRGVMVQGCGIKSNVLAIRAPTWDSLSDFWQCVFCYKVTNVVMLTELFENETVHSIKYWPDVGKMKFHRGLKVKLETETKLSNLVTQRVISVSSGRSRVNMVQFHYTGWKSDETPEESHDIKNLVSELAENCKTDESMLVHSGHTMNRAGTFLCLMSLLNRKRQERMIDVMRTVHNVRKKIPRTANSVDQYSFLYDMVEK